MISDLSEAWRGILDTGSVRAKLTVRLEPAGAGGAAWLSTRTDGDIALPLVDQGDRLAFFAPDFNLGLDLRRLAGGSRLAGECRLAGCAFPVTLGRGAAAAEVHAPRPQTPRGPTPYESRAVAFLAADGARLVGTLTVPAGGGTRAAVLLCTWHGRVDRDESVAGHRPFAIWADELTRRGLATLRFDKRGAGGSDGDFDRVTTADSVADLARALAFLRSQPDIDLDRIALLGHSEGSHISADLAAADGEVAACVVLTPGGAPEAEIFATDLFRVARAVGGRPLWPERSIRFALDLSEAVRVAATEAEAVARVRAVLTREAEAGRFPAAQIARRAELVASPWQRHWQGYDPTASLSRLACPVLTVFAGRDLQAPPDRHGPRVRAALAGNPRAEIVELAGLNHLLQPAITGAPSEYGAIDQTLAPEAIETVCGWLADVLGA